MSLQTRRAVAAFGAAMFACLAPAGAQTPEQFYAGRQLTMIVPTAPGGVNDIAGRLVARHLGKHLPGKPGIIVQNLPGAGGLAHANMLYNSAEKDGSVISMMERAIPLLAITGDPNAKFDPLKLTWLGSLSSYGNDAFLLLINSMHKARSVADIRPGAMTASLGANRSGSTNLTFALIVRDVLGLNVKVIRGYSGAGPMFLAQQRGEIDGQVVGYYSVRAAQPAMWNARQLNPIIQFGRATRHVELSDVPTGRELAPDVQARQLIELAELPFEMALPTVAPPGVPADRTAALRKAYAAMVADRAFLEDAGKINIEISPVGGDAIMALLQRASATPKAVIERYNKLAGDKG
jgi:tripartite-type tricarboxylate transporter receptor subunit TctC